MEKNELLKKYKYVYHRGFYDNKSIPENSSLAIKKAIEYKRAVEIDLRVLKDNTVVVYHDKNLFRLTGIDKNIKDCTYDEIKDLKLLNTNEKILTLNEVLKLVDNKTPLIIELKITDLSYRLEKETLKILNNYKGDFIIESFSFATVLYFRIFKNSFIRGILFSNDHYILQKIASFISKPDFIAYNKKSKNIKRNKSIPTFIYTIKNLNDFNKYKDLYDGFIIENIIIK